MYFKIERFTLPSLINRLTNCMLTKLLIAVCVAVLTPIILFSQSFDSYQPPLIVCPSGEYNGHHHTPPSPQILNRLAMRSSDNPCADIEVTYNNFPAEAENAFQAAVDIWAYTISSTVTIRITANWTYMGSGMLGSAGSTYVYRNFANAPDNKFYGSALADHIAGYDLAPGQADITANFNSTQNWYFGTEGGGTWSQYDFMSVVLHELGHGLGFASSASMVAGNGEFGVGSVDIPMAYDELMTLGVNGTSLLSLAEGPILGAAFTGNNVYCNGAHATAANDGVSPRFYAPSLFSNSSSLSHLNEFTYLAGSENSLMTPSMGSSEVIHNPGPIALGILQDLGWNLCSDDEPENIPCTNWQHPSPTSKNLQFNTLFDGAPCDFGNGCPFNEIVNSQVVPATAYEVADFIAGGVYTFSICNGPDAGSWIPEFTIIAPNGNVEAFGNGTGCAITWTASQSGSYTLIVNKAGQCGISNNQPNGYAALTCQSGTAICDPASCETPALALTGDEVVCPGETTTVTLSGAANIPATGGYGIYFYNAALNDGVYISNISLPYTFDNTLNGALPLNDIDELDGAYVVSGFVYYDADDFANTICGNAPSGPTITFLTDLAPECGGDPCMNDQENPIALCQNKTVSLNTSGLGIINAGQVSAGSTDNCEWLDLQLSKTNFTCADLGINEVILTATDASGNSDFCTAIITVVDGVKPSLSAPANKTVLADAGECSASNVSLGTPNWSDNCSATVSNNAPEIFPVGTTQVIWTATDPSGNTRTRNQYITVMPDETISLSIGIEGSATICQGEALTLSATEGFETYVWSNGETTSSITVSESGLYSVSASLSNECAAVISESVEITVLPDSDGDGICDEFDGCPADPLKVEPGACGCGTPDSDSDSDGIADCIDECPYSPLSIGDPCDDGDPRTTNDTMKPDCICAGIQMVTQIDGLLDWNSICGSREINIKLYSPGTTTLQFEYTGMIGETGSYSIPEVNPGEYDIFFKVTGYLSKEVPSVVVSPGINTLYVSGIIPGDITNTNSVNLGDVSILNQAYGSQDGQSNYLQVADYNCDGIINLIDFSILGQRFGLIGDMPTN